jgi:uncharacterized MAPEG superfamily protein
MTLLQMYALTAIVLAIKMTAVSIVQGRARTKAAEFSNPEDAKLFGGHQVDQDPPAVRRAARVWLNDLENIPIFLILAWIYVAAGLSAGLFMIYCVAFMLARILHTITYLNELQPMRTISFSIGALASLSLMITLLIKVVLA